ncbi:MAG: hypothetical protein HYT03_03165 [Candidatus Harrisonbacteria bacterium]|nr:hypothetical protein [Candidatus Harrisonbacteria bacterium]
MFRSWSVVFCVMMTFGCSASSRRDRHFSGPLMAAAGAVKITPPIGINLGGYFSPGRKAEGIHDDLYARCLVIGTPNGPNIAIVSVDLVGFLNYDVMAISNEVGITTAICSTHTHSGPDTIGIFGGRDEKYLEEVREKIAALIKETDSRLEPANIYFYKSDGSGLSKNWKEPDVLDTEIDVLLVKGKENTIATWVNFGCHPEAVGKANQITADFPGYLVKKIEKESGGVAFFTNGLLGGMVSIDTGNLENRQKGFELAREFGEKLADRVLAVGNAPPLDVRMIRRSGISVEVPVDNALIKYLIGRDQIQTLVAGLALGPLKIIFVPGELSPSLGLKFKSDPETMLVCLANDEIGYILPEEKFHSEIFENERRKSLGQKTGTIISEKIRWILKDLQQ